MESCRIACLVIVHIDFDEIGLFLQNMRIRTSRQNRTYLAVYAVVISSQMAYNMILTLTPFVNEELKASDIQYSLTFAGYYLMVLLSRSCTVVFYDIGSLCFGPISDRIGRRKSIIISLIMLVGCKYSCCLFTCSARCNVLDTRY